jgi:hypothetical protein
MTHAQALQRLRRCRENQPEAHQVLVAGEIVDALLDHEAKARMLRVLGVPEIHIPAVQADPSCRKLVDDLFEAIEDCAQVAAEYMEAKRAR